MNMNLLRITPQIEPIVCIENFLSEQEIGMIIEYAKELPSTSGKVGLDVAGEIQNLRLCINKWMSHDEKTDWLFEKLIKEIIKVNSENYNFIVNCFEDLQFTEYNSIQRGYYKKHNDCGNRLDPSLLSVRKISFTIQLSDENEYDGGELVLYNEGKEIIAPKSKGTLIFFFSHILHEVKPVTRGKRRSLVSWVHGPNLL